MSKKQKVDFIINVFEKWKEKGENYKIINVCNRVIKSNPNHKNNSVLINYMNKINSNKQTKTIN